MMCRFSFLMVLTCAAVLHAEEPHTKVLLIGKDRDHPPRSHEYMHECNFLAKCLRQTPGIEALVSNGWPKDPATLEGTDVVVLYTAMGGNVLSNQDHRKQVEDLLDKGVGLVMIHWSTGADDGAAGQWQFDHVGGWFGFSFSKFPVRDGKVHQLDPMHPICRGWSDHAMHDEYYTGLKFHHDAKPLLSARIDDKEETIAWTYERPGTNGGHSFGFVCGHFHDCFANESFRRSILNAILWAAKRDVPAEGVTCRVSDQDYILPPDPREGEKK